VVGLGELVVILELHEQGLSVSAIARRTGLHRETVRKYVERGLEAPADGPCLPRPTKLMPFEHFLRERIAAFPELTGSRLHREIGELGYAGADSDDVSHRFRSKPATCSDRSQPGIPMIPAG